MNQDQVKDLLLKVENCRTEFTLIFSGKTSKKVNGLYKPDSAEIILHNRNFEDDNQLVYTALHEYAHHLHAERAGGYLSPRAHGAEFWHIFHGLLEKAEEKKLYRNQIAESQELSAIAAELKEFARENGEVMRKLGLLLAKANAACLNAKLRFDDFVDRTAGIPRAVATAAIKAAALGADPALGWEGMKFVSSIPDPATRKAASKALLAGKSPDSVKIEYGRRPPEEDPAERLAKEKHRLERTIESLQRRLEDVEAKLKAAGG